MPAGKKSDEASNEAMDKTVDEAADEQDDDQNAKAKEPKAKAKPARKRQEKHDNPLEVPLFDSAGGRKGEVMLPKLIFAEKLNAPVIHQAYVRQIANARQGTASTKTRATVSGGGAKPYRQKGTGRARHGSIREPSMKGGGVVFGPHPRSYRQRMPKQMRRLALRSALSQKANEGHIRVIEAFDIAEPRTKVAADLMTAIGFDDATLVVLPAPNLVVSRSFENLPGAKIILARNLNIRDIFTHTYLLLAKDCLELLEENFSRPTRRSHNHNHVDQDDEHAHGDAQEEAI
jgi:large subunit ribosomal protein L4